MNATSRDIVKHAEKSLIEISLDGVEVSTIPQCLLREATSTVPTDLSRQAVLTGTSGEYLCLRVELTWAEGRLAARFTNLEAEVATPDDIEYCVAHILAIAAYSNLSVAITITAGLDLRRLEDGVAAYSHLAVFEKIDTSCFVASGLDRLVRRDVVEDYGLAKVPNFVVWHLGLGLYFSQRLLRNSDGQVLCLGTGSIPRAYADENSDVDLFLICLEKPNGIEVGEHYFRGIPLDIKVALDTGGLDRWNMVRRWHLLEGVQLYSNMDSSLEGFFSRLKLTREVRFDHIQCLAIHLGWIGFQPRSWSRRRVRGYDWPVSPMAWSNRGFPVLSNQAVDRAFGLLSKMLYLVNNQPYPGAKWQHFLLKSLEWLPEEFLIKQEKLFPVQGSVTPWIHRVEIILDLVDETFLRLEEGGLLAEDIYSHVIECFLDKRGFLDDYR